MRLYSVRRRAEKSNSSVYGCVCEALLWDKCGYETENSHSKIWKNVWNSSRIPLQTNNKPKWMDPFLCSRYCVCVGVQVRLWFRGKARTCLSSLLHGVWFSLWLKVKKTWTRTEFVIVQPSCISIFLCSLQKSGGDTKSSNKNICCLKINVKTLSIICKTRAQKSTKTHNKIHKTQLKRSSTEKIIKIRLLWRII